MSVCDPLVLAGADRVVGCWPDVCGYVCADAATASDNAAAAHMLPVIHFCIYPPENLIRYAAGCCNVDARSTRREEFCRRNQLAHVTGRVLGGVEQETKYVRRQLGAAYAPEVEQRIA